MGLYMEFSDFVYFQTEFTRAGSPLAYFFVLKLNKEPIAVRLDYDHTLCFQTNPSFSELLLVYENIAKEKMSQKCPRFAQLLDNFFSGIVFGAFEILVFLYDHIFNIFDFVL